MRHHSALSTGGVAALNPRLIAENPPVLKAKGILLNFSTYFFNAGTPQSHHQRFASMSAAGVLLDRRELTSAAAWVLVSVELTIF